MFSIQDIVVLLILFFLTVFVSFLFFPAFLFGTASVWSVVFSIIGALYLKKNLQEIVDVGREKYTDDLKLRARYSLIKYLCLVAKFIAIYSIPQCLLLFSYLTNALDGYSTDNLGFDRSIGFYDFALSITFIKSSFAELDEPHLLVLASLVASLFLFFAFLIICFKSLYRIFDWQFWGTVHYTPQRTGVNFPPKIQKKLIRAYGRHRAYYELVGGTMPILTVSVWLLLIYRISQDVYQAMDILLVPACSLTAFLSTSFIFVTLIALGRMSGRICGKSLVESLQIHQEKHQQILNNGEDK